MKCPDLNGVGMPSLEGILEVKSSSFRKFRPETGWQPFVLVWILREDRSVDRHEMSQADFQRFQEAWRSPIPEWENGQEENEDAQEQAG